jgi:glycine/D-amino acid oxidase-like deaminating enzyme
MTDLTLDSVRQYKELGVFTESGGYEVARTEERMEELRRRMSSAKAWGIHTELVTPDHVVERVPFLEKDKIVGAFWTPSVGVVDSLRAGTLMRESAQALGALTVVSTVEVTGLDVEEGRIRRVRTTGGDIEAETVVIACGVWSPKLAKMAGAHIPLTPAVHQMISVGPIPQLAERPGEISFPIVRDMDTFCYERQHGATWRWAPTPTARSCTTPRTSPRSSRRACRPPRCRSPPTTSTRSWSRRWSSCPMRWAPTGPRSATPSTACSRSRPTACRSSARRPR